MKVKKTVIWLLASALLLPVLASAESKKPVSSFRDALARSCGAAHRIAGADLAGDCLASAVTRRVISGHIVEYSTTVRVGTGEHDLIGLHRVVREASPSVAAHAAKAILFVHGDAWGFDAAFLSNLATPGASPTHAAPVYLAANGVDVWGIDLGWNLVPASTTDFSFFQGWGIERDARDVGIALALARLTRLTEGQGLGKIDLLGWSRGGQIGYAYMDAEATLPKPLRQVNGFVPVDIFVKSNDAAVREASCNRAAAEEAAIAAGTYASTSGGLFVTLGNLALTAPTGASPILPGFNNFQAGLLLGSATYALLPPGQSFVPSYHFNGGTFDASGLPTGLTYTPNATWFHFEEGASPYEPEQLLADGDAEACDATNVSWDDHLHQITAPVFYLGAVGGVGNYGLYSTTLLGSHDV
ncbi:MAG TPA: hypothetical protein VMM92_01520, partial [Thermoanaerobaculia bacterium]|nr:hypothetical protein [Thermoanaerobaculia bacterium]